RAGVGCREQREVLNNRRWRNLFRGAEATQDAAAGLQGRCIGKRTGKKPARKEVVSRSLSRDKKREASSNLAKKPARSVSESGGESIEDILNGGVLPDIEVSEGCEKALFDD